MTLLAGSAMPWYVIVPIVSPMGVFVIAALWVMWRGGDGY